MSAGLLPWAASAVLFLDVGTVQVPENASGFQFEIYVNNTGDEAVEVAGLIFNLQVADSGPADRGGLGSIAGPEIASVDILTGTAFASNNTGQFDGAGSLQFANASVTTGSGTVPLLANTLTLVATVTLDTTGFFSPGTWELRLGDTVNGSTRFLDASAESILPIIQNGFLVAVPEPAGMVALTALGALAWGGARRWVVARRRD